MSTDRARENDWTRDPASGRSNSSERFRGLCDAVERLIRGDAHMLLGGHADRTAALIIAQLAHVHGLVPLAAVVEALRERGEFACGGFEKEAVAFLEAEFGVPQPEQPA